MASINRHTFRLYNFLLLPLIPLAALYTVWRRYGKKRSSASLRGQQGYVPGSAVRALRPQSGKGGPCIWIHAVSVGETMAARPVARALRATLPDCRIGISVTTDTGFATAQSAVQAGEADNVFYFPLDLPTRVLRALNAVRPDIFITMETELWPNFLYLAHRRGVRTFLVNGRVSDNLLKTWPRLPWVWRWMMSNLDAALMRSQFDADRLEQLPGKPVKVEVVGDVKLDIAASPTPDSSTRDQWRQELKIAFEAPLWVAGSTHPGEEEIVLKVYQQVHNELPALRLVLAPRHIDRVSEVEQIVRAAGLSPVRRTECARQMHSDDVVIILDTVGELAQVYAAAQVAFVGGSLIERGGHNLLEPVLRGVPVVFGPHVANFREAAALAQSAEVGKLVHSEEELGAAIRYWLANDTERHSVAERAVAALTMHHGAAARAAEIIADTVRVKTAEPIVKNQ